MTPTLHSLKSTPVTWPNTTTSSTICSIKTRIWRRGGGSRGIGEIIESYFTLLSLCTGLCRIPSFKWIKLLHSHFSLTKTILFVVFKGRHVHQLCHRQPRLLERKNHTLWSPSRGVMGTIATMDTIAFTSMIHRSYSPCKHTSIMYSQTLIVNPYQAQTTLIQVHTHALYQNDYFWSRIALCWFNTLLHM